MSWQNHVLSEHQIQHGMKHHSVTTLSFLAICCSHYKSCHSCLVSNFTAWYLRKWFVCQGLSMQISYFLDFVEIISVKHFMHRVIAAASGIGLGPNMNMERFSVVISVKVLFVIHSGKIKNCKPISIFSTIFHCQS